MHVNFHRSQRSRYNIVERQQYSWKINFKIVSLSAPNKYIINLEMESYLAAGDSLFDATPATILLHFVTKSLPPNRIYTNVQCRRTATSIECLRVAELSEPVDQPITIPL